MVLLKRNKVELVPPPDRSDFPGDDPDVFYMAATGEIFVDYETYAARISFYNQPIFQDELTGRQNLTFFQAIQSERDETAKLHRRFPEALKSPVLKAVQFIITGRLDNLVDLVFDRFKERYFGGEAVFVDLQGDKYYARVIDVFPARSLTKWHTQRVEKEAEEQGLPFEPPHPSSIVHKLGLNLDRDITEVSEIDDPEDYIYSVNLIDESGQFTGSLMEVRSKQLSRDRLTFSKSILKKYLRECVVRDPAVASPWVVRHGLAIRYGISIAPSQETVAKNNVIKEGKLSKRKKLTDEEQAALTAATQGNQQKKRKMKAEAESTEALSTSIVKQEEKDKKKPIKFPIEDLEVDPVSERELKARIAGEQPRRRDRPPPSTELGMEASILEPLLVSYHFLQAFGKALVLSPFTLDEFEGALKHNTNDPPCTLIAEIFASLINLIARDGGQVKEPEPMAAPAASTRSAVNGKAATNNKKTAIVDDSEEEEEEEIDEEEESGDELDSREPTPAAEAPEEDEVKDGDEDENKKGEQAVEEEGGQRDEAEIEVIQAAASLGKGWEKKILRQEDGRRGWADSLCGILAQRASKDLIPRLVGILSHLSGKEHPDGYIDGTFVAASYYSALERFLILTISDKLTALHFLCDEAVMTKPIKSFFDECELNLTELRKERVDLGRQRKKIAEERAAEDKKREEEAEANGGDGNGAEESAQGDDGVEQGDVEMNEGDSSSRRSSLSKNHRRGGDTATPDVSMSATNAEEEEEDEEIHGSDSERDELESSPEADDTGASESESSEVASSAARRSLGNRQQALREKTLQRKAEEAARQASLAKQREEQKARNAENKRVHAERARWEAEEERITAREQAIDLEFRRYHLAPRLRPLGKDRFHDRYWWFDGIGNQTLHAPGAPDKVQYGTGRLFVQGCSEDDWSIACTDRSLKAMFKRRGEEHGSVILEHNQWAVYDQPEQIEQLISWLRIKGNREAVLKRQLLTFRSYLGPGMQKRLDEMNSNLKEQETRRSGRSKLDLVGPNKYLSYTNTQSRT
ncbi:unnamed protein product [Sympodiomycopsis kandeliae]